MALCGNFSVVKSLLKVFDARNAIEYTKEKSSAANEPTASCKHAPLSIISTEI